MKWACVFSLIIFFILSCTSDIIDPSADSSASGVCFETEVLPIFVSNCGNVGCHNSTNRMEGLDLTSFHDIRKGVKPGSPNSGEIMKSILTSDRGDVMPPPPADPLNSEQIKIIQDWIVEGALNNPCEPSNCDSLSNISFSKDVYPILNKSCLGCHNDRNPSGGYNYTNYNQTAASVNNGTLLGSIQGKSGFIAMPFNASPIPSCDIATVSQWISEGATNN